MNDKKKPKPKRKYKSVFHFALLAGIVFGSFFALGIGTASLMDLVKPLATANDTETEEESEYQVPDDISGPRINILVMGIDARKGETHSRSDAMVLVSIDPDLKKVALVSIPRDTRVTIKGGYEKIGAAYFYGGTKLAVDTVQSLLSIKISNYAVMDFQGFQNAIDAVGGVEIEVPQRMYKPLEGIDLKPGLQVLNGHDALAYVRFRDYPTGDIERAHQQHVFLAALAKEILKPSNLLSLPKIAREVKANIDTDLPLTTILKLATWIPLFSQENIIAQTLPGYFYEERDSYGTLLNSFWMPDKNKSTTLVEALFAGTEIEVFQPQAAPPTRITPAVSKTEQPSATAQPEKPSAAKGKEKEKENDKENDNNKNDNNKGNAIDNKGQETKSGDLLAKDRDTDDRAELGKDDKKTENSDKANDFDPNYGFLITPENNPDQESDRDVHDTIQAKPVNTDNNED